MTFVEKCPEVVKNEPDVAKILTKNESQNVCQPFVMNSATFAAFIA